MRHMTMRSKFGIVQGSSVRCMLVRALVIVLSLSVVSLLQLLFAYENGLSNPTSAEVCAANLPFLRPLLFTGARFSNPIVKPIWGSIESECKENVNLTATVVRRLMDMQILSQDAKALCAGEHSTSAVLALKEMGFSNVHDIDTLPFFSLKFKKLFYEIGFDDDSFDFVLSRDLDKLSTPALFVLEIERVLKPGGVGAVALKAGGEFNPNPNPNSLIRSATPITSLLKNSVVLHVDYVGEFTLVVFQRKVQNRIKFEQSNLPADCHSVIRNKPYMELIEPLLAKIPNDMEKRIHYLPRFVDVDSKERLVYINLAASEHLSDTDSGDWFLPNYPIDSKAFDAFFVDHNTSVLTSYVKSPRINFIYHPGLAGTNVMDRDSDQSEDLETFVEDGSFDFLAWFKETVGYADFVVLNMSTSDVELKFLSDLFNSGTICYVDELFLRCKNNPECLDIMKSLRSSGIFVHQWRGV